MTDMFDATLQLATRLGILRTSTATGGSTTTLVDTVARTEEDDDWNGGTVWIITDAGGASAAPEGEWAIVSDFVNSTATLTIGAVTAAVAAGDTYGLASGGYPLDVLKTAINNELIKQEVIRYDTTSLDIVADQSEYTLPVGIYGHNLLGVYESTDTDRDDNQWTPLSFSVQEAATGTQHTLVIHSRDVTSGNDIMLRYKYRLVPLYLASDEIDPAIPLDRILDAAATNAEVIRMRTYGSESELDIEMLKFYQRQAQLAEMRNPIRRPSKRGRVNEAHS